MKKILAIAMTVAMILCMATVFASAKAPNLGGTAGEFSAGSYAEFSKVGDITVHWMPDAQEKLNLKDGNMEDWAALGIEGTEIVPANMVSWVGHVVPEGWKMNTYFLADKDYLYIGFYITDPVVVPVDAANPANYGSGDSFQVNIDFGRKLGWILENDPDTAEILTNTQNVFYSFGYNGEGGPVVVQVQCSDNDRVLDEDDGVIGSTGKTDDGWCAEFTIPFQDMYNDYMYKAYLEEGAETAVTIDKDNPFLLGAGLYYLDKILDDTGAVQLTWAAGTHSGFAGTDADGQDLDPNTNKPIVRWDAYDNAMNLVLNYTEGMEFTCNGILVGDEEYETSAPETDPVEETKGEETKAEETKAEETKAEETKAEETKADETKADETKAETEAPKADDGCASVVGFGAVAVLAAAAAAVVLKKKD